MSNTARKARKRRTNSLRENGLIEAARISAFGRPVKVGTPVPDRHENSVQPLPVTRRAMFGSRRTSAARKRLADYYYRIGDAEKARRFGSEKS
jgi:hypothetical protein